MEAGGSMPHSQGLSNRIIPILRRINPIPCIDTYFFKIHSKIIFSFCLPEDNCFVRCFAPSQFKLIEVSCVVAMLIGAIDALVWWSACVLFTEWTNWRDFKIHNVMCVFMDKYMFMIFVPSSPQMIVNHPTLCTNSIVKNVMHITLEKGVRCSQSV